jgi:hypothetical protein
VAPRVRETGILIDGTDPFAAAKHDIRLIKLILWRAAQPRQGWGYQ